MKFKNEEAVPVSKYKQKRQSVVEINRLQLKLNQPIAKPPIGFESPHHQAKNISSQPPEQSIVKKSSDKKPEDQSKKTEMK